VTTASTVGIWQEIRTRLLTFAPPDGSAPLIQRLGPTVPRLYHVQPPDNVTYPYGVLTVRLRADGDDGDHRLIGLVESLWYGRPRSQQPVIEAIADVACQALHKWISYTDGLTFSGHSSRDTVPPLGEPADRELVIVRTLHELVCWPQWLAPLRG